MWDAIEEDISRLSGAPFRALERSPVGGGCINETYRLRGREMSLFLKLNSADRLSMFAAEAAGLEAIRSTASVRTPQVLAHGISGEHSWLALEYLDLRPGGPASAAQLGAQLALMHRASAQAFGWVQDNHIGATRQPNPWTADWVEFLQRQRIGFQLRLGRENGLPESTLARGEKLLEHLPALFEDYQPVPSLLHGDLWAGNWGSASSGEPVIYDPAVYFGDRESDLAMTELFGGFGATFYDAYRAAWPLDQGYELRRDLYQLYHILNHFKLFGGAYARQARSVIETLLQQLGRG